MSMNSNLISFFTESQIAELKETFEIFDLDQDGVISTNELMTIMKSLGQKVSDAELKIMISRVDGDESGTLSFIEFLSLMAEKMLRQDENYEHYKVFRTFDKDGNGVISSFELKLALKRKTDREDMINDILNIADKDGDGFITFNEFVKFMNYLPLDGEF